MFRGLSKTILFSITVPVVGMVLVLGSIFQHRYETTLIENVHRLLKEKVELFSPKYIQSFRTKDHDLLQADVFHAGKASDTRISLIAKNGVVLADSDRSPKGMDNHLSRPEIQAALKTGTGRSRRFSQSVKQEMFYFAKLLSDEQGPKGILRLSVNTARVKEQVAVIQRILIFTLLISVLVSLGIAIWLSRHIAKPIESITWGAKALPKGRVPKNLHLDRSDILGKLSRAIHKTGKILREQVAEAEHEKAKLNAMVKAMTEGVIAVNRENQILFCNPAACNLLGFKLQEPETRKLDEIVTCPEIFDYIAKARQMARSVHEEFSFNRSEEIIRMIAHVRTFGTEGEEGVVIVLHDVTQRRKLEQIRKDFVENASHELRTPLTAIKGYAETLADGEGLDPEKKERFLKKILQNVNRLTALTGDLMKLARIESKEFHRDDETINCNHIVADVLDQHQEPANWKQIELSGDFPKESIFIYGESVAFSEIVDNLVSNAIKYTDSRGRVSVRLAREEGHLLLRVTDTGIGIPEEQQSRIFERFYRVDKARSIEQGGTGLGLAIVKHRISQLNGTIHLESVEGQGTTFTVKIPAKSRA